MHPADCSRAGQDRGVGDRCGGMTRQRASSENAPEAKIYPFHFFQKPGPLSALPLHHRCSPLQLHSLPPTSGQLMTPGVVFNGFSAWKSITMMFLLSSACLSLIHTLWGSGWWSAALPQSLGHQPSVLLDGPKTRIALRRARTDLVALSCCDS